MNYTPSNVFETFPFPKNDRTRFTIHPTARKEVLKRLLALNRTRRAEEEEKAGLWTKETRKKEKIEKGRRGDGSQTVLF